MFCSFQCSGQTRFTKTKMQPLKMKLFKSVVHRYQMDLVELPVYDGYQYILRVVDHLSLHGLIAPIGSNMLWTNITSAST